MIPEISVEELKKKLDAKDKFQFVDVREPGEHAAAQIPGAKLVPLGELPKRAGELDKAVPVIVHCRSGGRSARAVEFLIGQGYDATNVAGGIIAWSQRIDPSIKVF